MPAILDYPATDSVVDRFGFMARGWVWLEAAHDRIAAVEIWSGSTQLGETTTLTLRPDVCAALGLGPAVRTGFEVMLHYPALPRGAEFPLEIRVRLTDGSRVGPLHGRTVASLGRGEKPLAVCLAPPPPFTETAPLPPENLQIRQVAAVWGRHFYREGWVILQQLATAFAAAGKPLGEAAALLDFGCGCGRVLRGFEALPHRGEITGSDLDAEAIAWNRAHHDQLARFEANRALPPTPFANGQFDAIYVVSVFTHLPDDLQFAWLTELRRLLRPGGVLVASLHGGHYWCKDDAELRTEVATRGFAYRRGAPTEGLPDFYMAAFHSEPYVREKWGRFFEVVAYHERLVHGVHDAAVLRRRDD